MSLHDQRGRHVSMGTCPLCERNIDTSQRTAWRLVDGVPARVHETCLRKGVAHDPAMGYSVLSATGAHHPKGTTMNLLKPAPVSIKQLSFSFATSSFTAEISSTRGLGRVYNDSCDEGLTVVGVTGQEVVFVVTDEARDIDGDLLHWNLRSTCGRFTMVLFND